MLPLELPEWEGKRKRKRKEIFQLTQLTCSIAGGILPGWKAMNLSLLNEITNPNCISRSSLKYLLPHQIRHDSVILKKKEKGKKEKRRKGEKKREKNWSKPEPWIPFPLPLPFLWWSTTKIYSITERMKFFFFFFLDLEKNWKVPPFYSFFLFSLFSLFFSFSSSFCSDKQNYRKLNWKPCDLLLFFLFSFRLFIPFRFFPSLSLFLFPSVFFTSFSGFMVSPIFPLFLFLFLFPVPFCFWNLLFCSTSFLGLNPQHFVEHSPIFSSFLFLSSDQIFLFPLFSMKASLSDEKLPETCPVLLLRNFPPNHQFPFQNQDHYNTTGFPVGLGGNIGRQVSLIPERKSKIITSNFFFSPSVPRLFGLTTGAKEFAKCSQGCPNWFTRLASLGKPCRIQFHRPPATLGSLGHVSVFSAALGQLIHDLREEG